MTYIKKTDTELEWSAEDVHGFSCSTSNLMLTNNSQIIFSNLKIIAFALLDTDQFPQNQRKFLSRYFLNFFSF